MKAEARSPKRTPFWMVLGLVAASACVSSSAGNDHDDDRAIAGEGGASIEENAGASSTPGGATATPTGGAGQTTGGGADELSGAGGDVSSNGGAAGASEAGGAGGETFASECTQRFERSLGAWDGRMPDGVCTAEHVCQVAPLPGNFDMKDMWGTSSSDLWIVGDRGSIVHFDGQTWTGIKSIGEPPFSQLGDGAAFGSVHGTAWNDVWVLGQYNQLLHFNGQKWSGIAYDGKVKAHTLWAQAPCDVWLFGEGGQASHFDGRGWTDMNVGSTATLYDAIGFASDDVWAVGDNAVVRWNGSVWTDASSGLEEFANLGAIWGASPDDLWAVGALKQFRKQAGGPWQKFRSTSDFSGPFDVTGSAADDVLLPPDMRFNGEGFDVVELSKKVWSAGRHDYWGIDVVEKTSNVRVKHQTELVTEYNREPFGVAFAPSPDTLYRWRLTGVGHTSVVERRVNGQYVQEATGLSSSYLLSGNSDTDIWVVDNTSCDSSHFDGSKWTKASSKLASDPEFRATRVAVTPNGDAWIGCGKQLARFESGAWTPKKTFTDEVAQVAADDAKVWVVTRSAETQTVQLFELANGVATPMPAPIEPAVAAPELGGVDASGRLWAASGNGYVSFYDGAWHNFPYRAFNLAVRGDEVWFTTYPDYVTYRFDGAGMKPYSTVCGPFTSVPVIAAPGDIWFSSYGGMCHLID